MIDVRIDELTPYKSTDIYKAVDKIAYSSIKDIFAELKKLGYIKTEMLGSGIFGAVFKRPNDPYVIKVFKHDKQYLKYLEYARQHQHNPHVPKIRGKIMKPYRNFQLYLVRIEELVPLSYRMDKQYYLYKKLQEYAYSSRFGPDDCLPYALVEVIDYIKSSGGEIDLHDENVMVRPSDGQLVITDPLK